MKRDTILYGPRGSGKAYISKDVAKRFGHTKIIYEATREQIKEHYGQNVLFITNELVTNEFIGRRNYRILSIKDYKE